MTRLELIEQSVRVSAVAESMRLTELRIRERRARQHRFRASAPGKSSSVRPVSRRAA